MITLAKTARLCNQSPSELLGIVDDSVAIAFNVDCVSQLHQWEMEIEDERELRRLEALGIETITRATGLLPHGPTQATITPDNFRDQTW